MSSLYSIEEDTIASLVKVIKDNFGITANITGDSLPGYLASLAQTSFDVQGKAIADVVVTTLAEDTDTINVMTLNGLRGRKMICATISALTYSVVANTVNNIVMQFDGADNVVKIICTYFDADGNLKVEENSKAGYISTIDTVAIYNGSEITVPVRSVCFDASALGLQFKSGVAYGSTYTWKS